MESDYPENLSGSSWFVRVFCVPLYCIRENKARQIEAARRFAAWKQRPRNIADPPPAPPNELFCKGFG